MSDIDIAGAEDMAGRAATRPGAAGKSPLRLLRLAVERPAAAVDFLHERSEGVMDLIAHFWERLSQTPPLSRGDLHLVVAIRDNGDDIRKEYISILSHNTFVGAMLYVPKAHRADVLALDPVTSAAFAGYITHQGPRTARETQVPMPKNVELGESLPVEPSETKPTEATAGDSPKPNASANGNMLISDNTSATCCTLLLTDLSGTAKGGISTTVISAEPHDMPRPNPTSANPAAPAAKVPIDFLTGHADGIRWMTPPLLAAVNRKAPAREMVNVVMQLPIEALCEGDSAVRIARDADLPVLNRWRRQYKEERGILFDADMDAWVQTGRVFVYEHDQQVVALAKFDLELPGIVEIGGVYTFPEFRTRGFGTRIVADLAARIRQMKKIPTLQVDEKNAQAVSLYQGMGWRPRGKLARIWLTG